MESFTLKTPYIDFKKEETHCRRYKRLIFHPFLAYTSYYFSCQSKVVASCFIHFCTQIYIQYTYIVGKYKIYLYELQKRAEQRAFGELFRPVSQRVQINLIFTDNVRILCLSCNVKKVGKLVRFKQKGQKQASLLAFHKCCQGCLLRGPRYISTSFILVCALRCIQLQGTRKVYSQAEKFIRLVRIKQKFIRIAYLYSKCTDCRIK